MPNIDLPLNNDWFNNIKKIIQSHVESTSLHSMSAELLPFISSGKMLRSKIAFCLKDVTQVSHQDLQNYSAAVEILHVATLLHDDIIDNAELRRGAPTFWKKSGVSSAVLLGDLLVCQGLKILNNTSNDKFIFATFIDLINEVCDSEIEQELISKNTEHTWDKCIDIARHKTGALFAMIACACGGNDEILTKALKEAGYLAGTAYQLADDIYDVFGDELATGKSTGRDLESGIITAMSSSKKENINPVEKINSLCLESENLFTPWPKIKKAWHFYLEENLLPVIHSLSNSFS